MPRKMSTKTIATLKSKTSLRKYLSEISDAAVPKPLAAFSAFPKSTTFNGQESGEHIVLLLRQHPATFIGRGMTVFFMFIVPLFISPMLNLVNIELGAGDSVFALGVAILWELIAVSVVFVSFFMWYFNVNIITNKRIIDIDFIQLFSHRVSECQLEKIEDVTHTSAGIWAVIFDFGNVYVQTAAEQREFEIINVPRPRDVQDTINDLLELVQP